MYFVTETPDIIYIDHAPYKTQLPALALDMGTGSKPRRAKYLPLHFTDQSSTNYLCIVLSTLQGLPCKHFFGQVMNTTLDISSPFKFI